MLTSSPMHRFYCLKSINCLLLDFEFRCWSTKQIDPKKTLKLLTAVIKEIWEQWSLPNDLELKEGNDDSEQLIALALLSNFKQSYKAEMQTIDKILLELSEVLTKHTKAETAAVFEAAGVFQDQKLAARYVKQGRKVVEDIGNSSRKAIQACSMYELMVSLLHAEVMKTSPKPLALFLRLLPDESLSPPAEEVWRDSIFSSMKKASCDLHGTNPEAVLMSLRRLSSSQNPMHQGIAREVFGWTELVPKTSKLLRCEESLFEQYPDAIRNYAVLEHLALDYMIRRTEGVTQVPDLESVLLCEWVWRCRITDQQFLEQSYAFLILKIWPNEAAVWSFISTALTSLNVTDWFRTPQDSTQLNQWMRKKGKPALLASLKSGLKSRSGPTPQNIDPLPLVSSVRIGLHHAELSLFSVPDDPLEKDAVAVQICRKIVLLEESNPRMTQKLIRHLFRLSSASKSVTGIDTLFRLIFLLMLKPQIVNFVLVEIHRFWMILVSAELTESDAIINPLLFISDKGRLESPFWYRNATDKWSAAIKEAGSSTLQRLFLEKIGSACTGLNPVIKKEMILLIAQALHPTCHSALTSENKFRLFNFLIENVLQTPDLADTWLIPGCVKLLLSYYQASETLSSLHIDAAVVSKTFSLCNSLGKFPMEEAAKQFGKISLSMRVLRVKSIVGRLFQDEYARTEALDIGKTGVGLATCVLVLQVLLSEDVQLVNFDTTELQPYSPYALHSDLLMFKNAEELLSSAWRLAPRVALRILRQCAYAFKTRFSALSRLIGSYLTSCPCYDRAVFAVQSIEDAQICYMDPPSIPSLLLMLGAAKPCVSEFARRVLSRTSVEAQLFYLPQIIQLALVQEEGDAAVFLREITSRNDMVRHRADWLLLSLDSAPALSLRNFITLTTDRQDSFLHSLAKVALTLVPKDPANAQLLIERVAVAETQSGVNTSHLEFPLNPELLITGLEPRATRPLRSAKRVPMLVQLRTEDKKTREKLDTAVIIKVNDDTRNDQLTLQFIELAESIFRSHGIPCYLRPYKILPLNIEQTGTHYLGCIMEVVPDCKSRDELWSEGFETLLSYFGSIASGTDLTRLKQNFTESMAAYSLLSYLLQIKDRHNGNLLFDSVGHIIHIDFGFILALSPGGNAGVENVEFKLTNEMVEALTSLDAFKRLFITGFFALQEYATELSAVFDLMKTSGIACFTPGAVSELSERFWTGKSRAKTAEKLVQMVYWAQDSMYTRMYDSMQKASQNIQS